MKFLNELSSKCKAWGGELLILPEAEMKAITWDCFPFTNNESVYSSAPFENEYVLGVAWAKKQVLVAERFTNWASVIHEMGHVFAADRPPDSCAEFNFFGWEWLLAKEVGASFSEWKNLNRAYIVTDDGYELAGFSTKDALQMVDTQIEVGERLRTIVDKRAMAIR